MEKSEMSRDECLVDATGQLHRRMLGKVCTRPVRSQAIPNPNMEREGGHEVPSLGDELLPSDGCWEKWSQLSLAGLSGPACGMMRQLQRHLQVKAVGLFAEAVSLLASYLI